MKNYIMLVLFLIGFALFCFGGTISDKMKCSDKAEIYDIETEFHLTGCYAVLEDGKMLMRHYEEQTQRTLNVNMVK